MLAPRSKITPPSKASANQYRASSSKTPTHSRKNRQTSREAALRNAAIPLQPPSCTGQKSVIQRSPQGQVSHPFLHSEPCAVENIRSSWTCVAGIEKTRPAIRARYGSSNVQLLHVTGFSTACCWIWPACCAASRASRGRASFRGRGHSPVWPAGR